MELFNVASKFIESIQNEAQFLLISINSRGRIKTKRIIPALQRSWRRIGEIKLLTTSSCNESSTSPGRDST